MQIRERRLQIAGIILSLLLILILRASAAQEDVIRKTFTFTDQGSLAIEADRGAIDVLPSADGQVSVTVYRKAKASSDAKERQMLDDHHVDFTQEGNKLRVVATTTRNSSLWSSLFGRGQLEVRYEVHLPVSFDASLKTAGGNIRVKELHGKLETATAGGDIDLGKVNRVTGHTSGGSIRLETADGNVDFSTSGGNIKTGKVNGDLSANTSGGHIEVGFVRGHTELHTSGGDIRVDQAGGSLQATTSGGSIRFGLATVLTGDCNVSTTGGDIRVDVPGKTAFNLDARTVGGNVSTEIPSFVAETKKDSTLRGQANGGGKTLKLRTTGGSIHVQKSEG